MPDVLKMLEADHRRVEKLLEELGSTEPGAERDALVAKLTASLQLHMEFEEQELYPLLQRLDAEMEEEAEVEHRLTREGIEKMASLTQIPGFGAAVDALKGGIDHHVKDEEEEAFPKLRREVGAEQLEALGATLMERKVQTGVMADELELASKEELLELARAADIEGRSSMSVDELRNALLST